MPRITVMLVTSVLAASSGLALALLGGWSDTPREEYFAQVAVGGGGTTAFLLHNPSTRTVRVHLELRDGRGRLFEERTAVLAAGATRREEFGGPEGKAVAGWARIRGDGPFAATELIRAGPSPWVGVLASRPTTKFRLFGMVEVPGLRTGVALANPNAWPSRVQARLYGEEGSLLHSAEFELGALGRKLLATVPVVPLE